MNGPEVVTFAQLPEEEVTLISSLAESGEIWARSLLAIGGRAPAPLLEFVGPPTLGLFAIESHIFLGFREEVLASAALGQAASLQTESLVSYSRGRLNNDGVLSQANLCYYSSLLAGGQQRLKTASFLHWAAGVLEWARQYTPELVPVHRCSFMTRATSQAAARCAQGLKIGY
jgi:hypothetical protein